MNILLSLVLATATALMPHSSEQPSQRITISARVFFPAGKAATAAQQRITLGSGPATWYVFTGKTLCEGLLISAEKPSVAGSGWKVEVEPAAQNTVQVRWTRLWVGGKAGSGGSVKTLAGSSGSPAVLDSIDGGTRLQLQAYIDRMKSISPTDLTALRSLDELQDGLTSKLENQLAEFEKTRRTLIEAEHLGAMNARVMSVDANITATRKQLLDALDERLASRLNRMQSSPPTSIAPVDGCDALSLSLQVAAEPLTVSQATETEIWLVHKDPSGTETMQRQVVRSANGNGSYVFDDVVVKTEHGPITVEVYGYVGVTTDAGTTGPPWLNLEVNRRYVATGPGVGWKTKEGGTAFHQAVKPDEVVAFNLVPLKDDEGALVGHHFSVRVRTKILK